MKIIKWVGRILLLLFAAVVVLFFGTYAVVKYLPIGRLEKSDFQWLEKNAAFLYQGERYVKTEDTDAFSAASFGFEEDLAGCTVICRTPTESVRIEPSAFETIGSRDARRRQYGLYAVGDAVVQIRNVEGSCACDLFVRASAVPVPKLTLREASAIRVCCGTMYDRTIALNTDFGSVPMYLSCFSGNADSTYIKTLDTLTDAQQTAFVREFTQTHKLSELHRQMCEQYNCSDVFFCVEWEQSAAALLFTIQMVQPYSMDADNSSDETVNMQATHLTISDAAFLGGTKRDGRIAYQIRLTGENHSSAIDAATLGITFYHTNMHVQIIANEPLTCGDSAPFDQTFSFYVTPEECAALDSSRLDFAAAMAEGKYLSTRFYLCSGEAAYGICYDYERLPMYWSERD